MTKAISTQALGGIPLVTVVIPTIGRLELKAAVQSAIAQSIPIEVVVVVDRAEKFDSVVAMLQGYPVRIIMNPGVGAPAARNAGVSCANTEYIAFLDDDDFFYPSKLELQLEQLTVSSGPRFSVCGTAYKLKNGRTKLNVRRMYDQNVGSLADYLLTRKWPWIGTPIFCTSSLIIDRQTIQTTKWDESLPCHQDIDLFIRLADISQIQINQIKLPLVEIQQGSTGSITWTRQLKDNFRFIEKHGASLSSQTLADFVMLNIVAREIRSHNFKSAMFYSRTLCKTMPHMGSILRALAFWWKF